MNGVTKFIIGGVATSLMAMAGHSAISGAPFVDKLQAEADARLATLGAPGVTASLGHDMLSRNVVLSGAASQAEKDRIIAAIKAIPGIGSVTWDAVADAADAMNADKDAAAASPETPAAPEVVANCQADVDRAIAGKEIHFNTADAGVRADSAALLDSIANVLKPCAGVTVEVAGHTDAQGAAAANMSLSQSRATSVVAALTERGVPAGRLQPKGYGETQPKVPTGPDDKNDANRRIEFRVSSTAAPAATE